MSFVINDKMKSTLIIYAIIIAIILIQKPKILFNDNMELKILVLSKDKSVSIPLLYVVVLLGAAFAYYIPRYQ
jgi:hypothetical protein